MLETCPTALALTGQWFQMVCSLEHPPTVANTLDTFTCEQLIAKAATLAFPDSPGTVGKVIESYKKDKEPEYDIEDDPETAELIEEMAVTDQVNSDDLKSYRDDLKKKAIQKLAKMNGEERKKRVEVAKKKKAKSAAVKKGKGKVNIKFAKGVSKKISPTSEAPVDAPAAPPPSSDTGQDNGALELPAASGSWEMILKLTYTVSYSFIRVAFPTEVEAALMFKLCASW